MAGGGMQSPSTLGGIPGIPQRGKQGIVAPLGGDPIAGGTLPGIETATAMGMPPRGGQGLAPGGATAGPQPGGAGMGAPAGLSPEVLQMIQAALGGQMPLGAAGMPPRAGGPAGFETLPGGPAVPQRGGGPAGFITPPGGAAVPQRGGAGMGTPPLRPVPAPLAPPQPASGFMAGAAPMDQRRWAQYLVEGTQR